MVPHAVFAAVAVIFGLTAPGAPARAQKVETLEDIRAQAEAGRPSSQFLLGVMYFGWARGGTGPCRSGSVVAQGRQAGVLPGTVQSRSHV